MGEWGDPSFVGGGGVGAHKRISPTHLLIPQKIPFDFLSVRTFSDVSPPPTEACNSVIRSRRNS